MRLGIRAHYHWRNYRIYAQWHGADSAPGFYCEYISAVNENAGDKHFIVGGISEMATKFAYINPGFYRIIFIGRWSMLDIFMISILVSLVDLGGAGQVIAGPAATAFAAVVVLTMLATNSFDPRLLWDRKGIH